MGVVQSYKTHRKLIKLDKNRKEKTPHVFQTYMSTNHGNRREENSSQNEEAVKLMRASSLKSCFESIHFENIHKIMSRGIFSEIG